MKVYVASSFSLIDKVEALVDILEDRGHEITVKWWKRIYELEGLGLTDIRKVKKLYEGLDPNEFYSKPETGKSYQIDVQGIRDADAFIFVASDIPRNYGGANIELGFALAWGKLCLSVGSLPNSPLYFEVIQCERNEGILDWLFCYGEPR